MLHVCIFKKIQLSQFFVFCIFVFLKNTNSTLCIFFVCLYFPKSANSKKYKHNTNLIQKKYKKMQSVEFAFFEKYKNTKKCKCGICIF